MEDKHNEIWLAINAIQEDTARLWTAVEDVKIKLAKLETHARLLDKSVTNLEDFIYGADDKDEKDEKDEKELPEDDDEIPF